MSRRNPVLDLPAAKWLADLPQSARLALREVLLELGQQAEEQAQHSWTQRKGPMAAYYLAVGVYARHIARAIPDGPDAEPTLPLVPAPGEPDREFQECCDDHYFQEHPEIWREWQESKRPWERLAGIPQPACPLSRKKSPHA